MSNPEPAAGTIGATTPAGVEKPPQKKISLFEVDYPETQKADEAPPKEGSTEAPRAYEPPQKEYQFFGRDANKRICIPSYCKRLKEDEKYAIATKATKLVEAWQTAGGAAQTEDTLPGPVDGPQFIEFYKVS